MARAGGVPWVLVAALWGSAIVAGVASVAIGAYPVSLRNVFGLLVEHAMGISSKASSMERMIVDEVRLPRMALTMLVGANLAVAGCVLQTIFRNPLVSPYLLGIPSGASFGAALLIVCIPSVNALGLQVGAFAWGGIAVVLAVWVGRRMRDSGRTMLVLAGVLIASLFSSLTAAIQYAAEPDQLQRIVFWTLGSCSKASWQDLSLLVPVSMLGNLILLALAWPLNAVAIGELEAHALGVRPDVIRAFVIVAATMVTTSSVAVCGPIGWIGLMIPHLARRLVGVAHTPLLLAAASLGAMFLLACDIVARTLTSSDLPIGLVTSIVGIPAFAVIMSRKVSEN